MKDHQIEDLPLRRDLETKTVLKTLNRASRLLGELKGVVQTIPNENILVNTLTLQEAQDSSAVENIITTQDELYRAELAIDGGISIATKEVQRYAIALREGYAQVKRHGLITQPHIIKIQAALEQNNAGFRRTPGTKLMNDRTGEVVYTPPQHPDEIERLLQNLVVYINDDEICPLDPLIKMAIIHHQFESIHPFYDGNGRTGRIINILYLITQGLLDLPILYLSRYIIRNKQEYYRLLQGVRNDDGWEEWVVYMLEGVAQTAEATINLIREIKSLMQQYKVQLRKEQSRMYSQDLLNNIFRHPYTKIDFVMQELSVSRPTATTYLNTLTEMGMLTQHKIGRSYYYVNDKLISLLS